MPKSKFMFNDIAPRGSALYYSLLNVPETKRNAIIALHALHFEISKISERYKELSVAQTKLAWWQDEIKRLYQGGPNHPITQALQAHCAPFAIPEPALQAMIAAAHLSMTTEIYPSQTELSHHYQHTGGLLELLKTRVLADGTADLDTEQYAQTLGIALETIRHLYDFAEHLGRGHIYLPGDQLNRQQVAIENILQYRDLDKLRPLFAQQANYARQQYQIALKRLPAAQFATQRPSRIYAALQVKLLDAMEKDGYRVFKYKMQLSPLQKLWWSYRTP